MMGEFWPMPQPEDRDVSRRSDGVAAGPTVHLALRDRLERNPLFTGATLTAELVDGVLVLRGKVASREAYLVASREAGSLDGVRDVCNQVVYPRD